MLVEGMNKPSLHRGLALVCTARVVNYLLVGIDDRVARHLGNLVV